MAAVGRRLRAAAPDARVLTRLGRRELLVIAPGDAADLADELGPIVSSHPVDLGSVVVRASISVGYAAWDGESAGELLRRCGEALEAARDAGGDCAEAAVPAADALPAAA
jgi:GGDEF domain-containing protein